MARKMILEGPKTQGYLQVKDLLGTCKGIVWDLLGTCYLMVLFSLSAIKSNGKKNVSKDPFPSCFKV